MRIITTNDGLFGLDLDSKCEVIWCHNRSELSNIGWHALSRTHRISKPEFDTELNTAIDIMRARGDDVAVFGMRGKLLWTTQTEDVA